MAFCLYISLIWKFLVMEYLIYNFTNSTVDGYETKGGRVFISKDDQEKEINKYHIDCLTKILYGERPTSALYCNRTWDKIKCWPDTEPGTTVMVPCPDYIHGFYVGNYATKRCMPDGHWYAHPVLNRTWTNYSDCYDHETQQPTPQVSELIEVHMSNIRLMYNIGYSLSLISLTIAVLVMVYFKRLHCPRNTVHVNLFLSMILRATLSILKETLLVQGLGLQIDVETTPYDDTVLFIEEGMHWECKLLFTSFYYVLSASYMWIFVEGLHLHTLIKVSVFSERSSIKYYIFLGWGTPVLFVIPWVVVRITKENVLCWNTNPTPGFLWIIKGPIVLSIAVNFIFFLNILRALITKMKSPNSRSAKKHKYRRMAKATLVLIPLFGVHYIVFIGFQGHLAPETEVVKLYYEMFFNSFQGLVVAVLFCFLNGQVQMEILKLICRKGPYYRYRRYYRTSMGHSSSKCTCHCHKHSIDADGHVRHSNSDPEEHARRYSEGANTYLNTEKKTRTCVCRWRIDSNGHVRRYVKPSSRRFYTQDIQKANSCV